MDRHVAVYYVGISTVFFTHAYTLALPKSKPLTSMKVHAWVNIAAAIMIAYYFLHKEKVIRF